MHPILFKIPLPHWKLPMVGELHAFPIYAYGVMLGLSLVVGWYISLGIAKSDGLPRETMANNYVFTAICAIVGSRLLYIVTNLDEFKTWKDMLAIRSGGLVAYGGFLGGFLGSWWFCARRKIRLLAWADAAVPSLASGLFFTRIGCYLFGCDFGKPLSENAQACATNAATCTSGGFMKFIDKVVVKAGTFPEWHYDHKAGKFLDLDGLRTAYADPQHQILSGSPAWVQHTESFPQVRDLHHSVPVHPTQLYECLAGAALFATLWFARKSAKKREAAGEAFFRGEIFLVFTFGYGVLRFLIEIVRDDAERKTYGPYLEPHVVYPLALMGLALAFVFGLSNMIPEKKNLRTIWRCVAILIPLGIFMVLRPANKFELVERVQLSTSQWIAIVTGMAAAVYYRRGLDLAIADPITAADLGEGVPALVEAEAAAERGETPEPTDDEDDRVSSKHDPDDADDVAEDRAADKKAKRDRDEDETKVEKPVRAMQKTLREVPGAKAKSSDDASDLDEKKSETKDDEKLKEKDAEKSGSPKKDEPEASA